MYNNSKKKEYLSEFPARSRECLVLNKIFLFSEPIEQECGKDLAMLSEKMTREFWKKWTKRSEAKATNEQIEFVGNYTKWYRKKGYGPGDPSSGKVSKFEKIRDTMFSSPLHLQMELDKLFDSVSLNTLDCTYRASIWLVYAGIPHDACPGITSKDIVFLLLVLITTGQASFFRPNHCLPCTHAVQTKSLFISIRFTKSTMSEKEFRATIFFVDFAGMKKQPQNFTGQLPENRNKKRRKRKDIRFTANPKIRLVL